MAFVIVRCPDTGLQVYTGIDTDPDLLDLYQDGNTAPLECPHCRQLHSWSKSDAVFLDPDRWSEDPEVKGCLDRAREALKRAGIAESAAERASCMFMAHKWIALAERWRVVAETEESPPSDEPSPEGSPTVL